MIRPALLLFFAPLLFGQTPIPARMIHATGTASVTVRPDQAKFTVSVVTRAGTAQDAAAQNAGLTAAVTAKLTSVLTGRGSIKTVSYVISPVYNNGPNQ